MIKFRAAAFTLIEILVTVGILCILAAIAVPNLIEAQTRAKVARVKNDQRVITEALEGYWNANEDFPRININCGLHRSCKAHPDEKNHTACERRSAGWLFHVYKLTTPIAYLTTTDYPDPFIKARAHRHMPNGSMILNFPFPPPPPNPDDKEIVPTIEPNIIDVPLGDERDPVHLTYMYATQSPSNEDVVSEIGIPFHGRVEYHESHRPGYYLVSVGPDNLSGPDPISGQLWNIYCYSRLNDHTKERNNTYLHWQYDPSNGTQSWGDIIRCGEYFE